VIEATLLVVGLIIGTFIGWLWLSRWWPVEEPPSPRAAELERELIDTRAREREARDEGRRLARELDQARSAPAPDTSARDARIAELEAQLEECRAAAAVEPPPAVGIRGVAAPEPGVVDDLRLIKGIGPVLAKVLNDYGIVTFKQIADLDEAGVDLVQEQLTEFPGRIRRDDWVPQARALQREHHGD
jgi:predicted flap endonuclease-1-like 5' DNA nuclease